MKSFMKLFLKPNIDVHNTESRQAEAQELLKQVAPKLKVSLTPSQVRAQLIASTKRPAASSTVLFKKPTQPNNINAAIFIDCDETIVGNARLRGSLRFIPQLIDAEKWRKLNALAIEHNVALYILTAREDYDCDVDLISSYIDATSGFSNKNCKQEGGFNRLSAEERLVIDKLRGEERILQKIKLKDFIYFTRNSQGNTIMTKEDILVLIHRQNLSHLAKSQILFIDNLTQEIDPIKKNGYQTLIATMDGAHFEKATQFIHDYASVSLVDHEFYRI